MSESRSAGNRPLSPHLTIYKPQVTSIVSITHRATGVWLAMGAVVLAYWLNAGAYGPEAFARTQSVLSSWLGLLFLLGWTFSLYFHLCNGIRHLFWDAGKGFEMNQVNASGWSVIAASILFTGLTWLAGFGLMGGGQ